MNQPLFHDGLTVRLAIDGTGVGVPIGCLCPAHGDAQVRPRHIIWPSTCPDRRPLREHLVPVAGVNCGIPIPVKHDRRDHPGTCPRRWEAAVPRLRGARPSVLHRGECGGEIVGGTIGETRMDADGGIEIGVAHPHDRGHRSAGRQSDHVHPLRIHVVGAHDLARDAGKDGRFAMIPVLVGRLEPVPTFGLVGGDRLCRIDNQEQFPLCEYIHTGASGEILWGLGTAVEHDDQRQSLPAIAIGDV